MGSPRFLRQDTITIVNVLQGEINNVKRSKETELTRVKVNTNFASKIVTNKSSNQTAKDDTVITIDCNDVEEQYVSNKEFDGEFGWTVSLLDDYVIFNGKEMKIVGFTESSPFGKVEFVELICQSN